MPYKNRIKDTRIVKGRDLLSNPLNWRTHPEEQVDALEQVLGAVGKVGALVAWESPGGLMLLDGHARVQAAPDDDWTVLVLDVSEAEANSILLSYDALTGLATVDEEKVKQLTERIRTIPEVNGEALAEFIDRQNLPANYFDNSETDGAVLLDGLFTPVNRKSVEHHSVICPYCKKDIHKKPEELT